MIWSSHPLSLASTPSQVYIDGIPQLSLPDHYVAKGPTMPPRTPNFDTEKVATVMHEGLPPIRAAECERGVIHECLWALYERWGLEWGDTCVRLSMSSKGNANETRQEITTTRQETSDKILDGGLR